MMSLEEGEISSVPRKRESMISNNFDKIYTSISNGSTMSYNRRFYNKLFSKPDLKMIIFVEDSYSLVLLHHHYELNPEEFEVVILFKQKPTQDLNSRLISYMSSEKIGSNCSYIDCVRKILFTIHSIVKLEIAFAYIFDSEPFFNITNSLQNSYRKIIKFRNFKCKSFVYLFLYYVVNNGIQIQISPSMHKLMTTIDYETCESTLKDIDDTGIQRIVERTTPRTSEKQRIM